MPKGQIDRVGRLYVSWLISYHQSIVRVLIHIHIECPPLQDQDPGEVDDHQSLPELLDLVRANIKRLRGKNILRTELYTYLIDLIEEGATIGQDDVWYP